MDSGSKTTHSLKAASETQLKLVTLGYDLSVCKCMRVEPALLEGDFYCIAQTNDELSVVCETAKAPSEAISREDGWRALKVCGPLDFGLVGILAKISSALADAGVPLFAISTYDTDYILVKAEMLETAATALRYRGCQINGIQESATPTFQ